MLVQAGEEGVAGGPAEGAGVPVWSDEGTVGGGGGGEERHFFLVAGGLGGGRKGKGKRMRMGKEEKRWGWLGG